MAWLLAAVLSLACLAGGAIAEEAERHIVVEADYDGAWVNLSEHSFRIFLPDGWELVDAEDEAALMTAIDPETGNRMWIESMDGGGFTMDGVFEMFSQEEGLEGLQRLYINEHPFVHYISPESDVRGFITLTADAKHVLIFKFSPADDGAFTRYAEMIMSTLSAYVAKAAKAADKKDEQKKPSGIQTWAELVATAKAGKTEVLIAANLTRGDSEETAVFHSAVTIKSADGNMYTIDGNGQQSIRIESETSVPLTETSTISGLEFVNGQAAKGGALFAQGDLVVEDCEFTENSASNFGGAIYVEGDLSLTDTVLTLNTAGQNGGGAFAMGDITISDCQITQNEATFGGGGVSSAGSVTVNGGVISQNEATFGGGVFAAWNVTVEDGQIDENSASVDGGGVYASMGNAYINGGTISGNTAGNEGGGVNAIGVTMNDGVVADNEALKGGGIYAFNADVVVNGGEISGNEADKGGGIYAANADWGSGDITVNGGSITGNTANTGSAAYAVSGTVSDPNGCIVGDVYP